jgi:DtxR family transcriptional regulator, Mn-dependent transcriptional regulator
MKPMVLTESQEDYLEAILALEEKNRVARVSDIAESLDVKKSSVTAALRGLAKRNLVEYSPYAQVRLTAQGKLGARALSQSHRRLKRFFIDRLGVSEEVADRNACRMEHALDPKVMERLLSHLERRR